MKITYYILIAAFWIASIAKLSASISDLDKERINNAIHKSSSIDNFNQTYRNLLQFSKPSPFFFSQAISYTLSESASQNIFTPEEIIEHAFRLTVEYSKQNYDNSSKITKTTVSSVMLQSLAKQSKIKDNSTEKISKALIRGAFYAVNDKSKEIIAETLSDTTAAIASTLTIYFLQSPKDAIPMIQQISYAISQEMTLLLSDEKTKNDTEYIFSQAVSAQAKEAILTSVTTEQNTNNIAKTFFTGLFRGILDMENSVDAQSLAIQGTALGCIEGVTKAASMKSWMQSSTTRIISSAYIASFTAALDSLIELNNPDALLVYTKNIATGFTTGISQLKKEDWLLNYSGLNQSIKYQIYQLDTYNQTLDVQLRYFQNFATGYIEGITHPKFKKDTQSHFIYQFIQSIFQELLTTSNNQTNQNSSIAILQSIYSGASIAFSKDLKTETRWTQNFNLFLNNTYKLAFSPSVDSGDKEAVLNNTTQALLSNLLPDEPKKRASLQVRKEVAQRFSTALIDALLQTNNIANPFFLKLSLDPLFEQLGIMVLEQNQRRPRTSPPISHKEEIQIVFNAIEKSQNNTLTEDAILFTSAGISSGLFKPSLSHLISQDNDYSQATEDIMSTLLEKDLKRGNTLDVIRKNIQAATKGVMIGITPVYTVSNHKSNLLEHSVSGLLNGYRKTMISNKKVITEEPILDICKIVCDQITQTTSPGDKLLKSKIKGTIQAFGEFLKQDEVTIALQSKDTLRQVILTIRRCLNKALDENKITKQQYVQLEEVLR
jgi:hypothetical protein